MPDDKTKTYLERQRKLGPTGIERMLARGRPVPKRKPATKVEKAKAVLKKAEGKKPGPPPRVDKYEPWKALGISRATYFNRKKAGTL